jgi:hypothetical protein
MKLNLHEECKTVFAYCKALTSAAAVKSAVIDRRGYNGVEFVFAYGLTASAVDTHTLTILESDTATTGDFTSVADANLAGTEALAGRAAGLTSGVGINVAKRIGYKGNKRYVRASIVGAGSATMLGSCVALLYAPEAAATTNP